MRNKKRYYRKFDLDVSREEVERIVREYSDPEQYSHSVLAGPYTPPDVDTLVGLTLAFRGEEKDYDFRFTGLNEVWFKEAGAEEKRCFVNVKTLDGEVFFVNFLVPGYATSRQITLVPDLKTGCATVVDAHIGTEHSNIDVDRDFYFGRLEGDYAGGEAHGFTTELVGKSIIWEYSPKIIKIKHIYNCDIYYTYKNLTEFGTWMACNPADYVKIRDGLFLFSFVEERQVGVQAIFLIDLGRMHDIGCFYGVSSGHLTSACIGAVGEMADPNTIA
jgi:Molybdenum cofactor biosynthesis protein F.